MSRLTVPWTTAVLLALAANLLAAGGKDTVRLEETYPPGSYVMTQQMKMHQDIAAAGQPPQKQDINQRLTVRMDVEPPDASGVRVLTLRYERVVQKVGQAGAIMTYDSAGPEEKNHPALAASLAPLAQAEVTVHIDSDNTVQAVKGLDAIFDAVSKQNPQAARSAKQWKKQFGDQAVGRLVERGSSMYPDKAVAVGESWNVENAMALPFLGDARTVLDCRLDRITGSDATRTAVITYTGTMQIAKPKAGRLQGANTTFKKASFEQKGTILYDLERRMGRETHLDQEGSMVMEITPPGKGGPGQAMTVTVDQHLTMTQTVRPAGTKAGAASKEAGEAKGTSH